MPPFLEDPFDGVRCTLALGLTSRAGPELGEVQATCVAVVDGEDAS
jgi:hypothetical protein